MEAREKRTLPCVLTEAERVERGMELGEANQLKTQLELLKKQATSEFNGKIEACQGRIDKLASACKTGKEPREVMCTWVPDYQRGRKVLARDDTGEVIPDTECMLTAEERQGRLLS